MVCWLHTQHVSSSTASLRPLVSDFFLVHVPTAYKGVNITTAVSTLNFAHNMCTWHTCTSTCTHAVGGRETPEQVAEDLRPSWALVEWDAASKCHLHKGTSYPILTLCYLHLVASSYSYLCPRWSRPSSCILECFLSSASPNTFLAVMVVITHLAFLTEATCCHGNGSIYTSAPHPRHQHLIPL